MYYVIQMTSFEVTFVFYGLIYGIKEAIQPYMSYVWFPRIIYGGQPGRVWPAASTRKSDYDVEYFKMKTSNNMS